MHLYDPDRPQASPGRPALLIDGAAVPALHLWPEEDTDEITVSVMLRNASDTFSWRHVNVRPVLLGELLASYKADPETTLLGMFGWKPTPRTKNFSTPGARRPTQPRPVRVTSDGMEDLL